jgi:hypothetical protein
VANPLEGYESVAERVEKFWMKYMEIGRIDTDVIYQDGQRYIVKAFGYREITDLVPFATGLSEEVRSSANRFPLENAETSAIGRMLHNAGISKFSENPNRPSYEEMRRVGLSVVPEPTAQVTMTVTEARDPWSFGAVLDNVGNELVTPTAILNVETCQHGPMAFKEGVNGKTGKPYKGFVCTEKNRDFQCPARWFDTK